MSGDLLLSALHEWTRFAALVWLRSLLHLVSGPEAQAVVGDGHHTHGRMEQHLAKSTQGRGNSRQQGESCGRPGPSTTLGLVVGRTRTQPQATPRSTGPSARTSNETVSNSTPEERA